MKNNKKGAAWIMLVIAIGIIAIVGLVSYAVFKPSTQEITFKPSEGGASPETCADSTATLTVNAVNALQKGTTVSSPTITCGVDDGAVSTSVTSGTTTFPVAAQLTCLVSKADYIDREYSVKSLCGGTTLQAELYSATSDNPSISIKDLDTSTTALSDNVAGATVNVSNIAAGDVLNLEVAFQGTALESSGDGIYIIELPAGSNANVTAGDTGVSLGNLVHTSIPSVHTTQNAGSRIDAFEVPAIMSSEVKKYDLLISLQATKDLAGGVYTDWYAKQAFVDTDGTIKIGVQDSTGTAKYENTLDYDFYINAA